MKLNSDYPDSGCWELRGYRDKDGYTKVDVKGDRTYQAHRYAYQRLVNPDLTSDVILMHTCDNPPCWNPEHLRPGTHAANVKDKITKNRHIHGEITINAKLDTDKVRDIRARREAGETLASIARRYDIDPSTARLVVIRATWAHV